MESLDLRVLTDALAWRGSGHAVMLVTVVQTWGSAPRPPGALLAVRDDGAATALDKPTLIAYGVSHDEASRFGLPCGGTLRLLQEPLLDTGQLSQAVAQMAAPLDFEVLVCDPREEYAATLVAGMPSVRRLEGMPDDVVRDLQPDAHTAIVALTHDPKLDDMALIEALKSDSRDCRQHRGRAGAGQTCVDRAACARSHGRAVLNSATVPVRPLCLRLIALLSYLSMTSVASPTLTPSPSCRRRRASCRPRPETVRSSMGRQGAWLRN